MYIRRWRHVERRTERKCGFTRGLEEESKGSLRGFSDLDGRFLSQIPVDGGNDDDATELPMQQISYPYYNREFHPYDWYVTSCAE